MELWDIYDSNRNKTGRTVERGKPMANDEFHLVVHVWIMNQKGEYLISKRTPNKAFPNMWECTGGSAIIGDDSLTAALRETEEELGVTLDPKKGWLFLQYTNHRENAPQFTDIWLFKHDCPIESIVFQEFETCDAMWASRNRIYEMIDEGIFIGKDIFPYIDALLYHDLVIREIRADDYKAIHSLNKNGLGYDFSLEKTKEKLQIILSSKADKLFVAESEHTILGYIHLASYECTYADSLKNILAIVVSPNHRGKGIGKALLSKGENWAREEGSFGIRLVSGFDREEAHQFYTACGFTHRKNQKNFIKLFE